MTSHTFFEPNLPHKAVVEERKRETRVLREKGQGDKKNELRVNKSNFKNYPL